LGLWQLGHTSKLTISGVRHEVVTMLILAHSLLGLMASQCDTNKRAA